MPAFRYICRQGLVWLALAVVFGAATFNCAAGGSDDARGVRVVPNLSQGRVDVLVDGKLFTAYIFPKTLKKPVLFLSTRPGNPVTAVSLNRARANAWITRTTPACGSVRRRERRRFRTMPHLSQAAGKDGHDYSQGMKRTAGGKDKGELEVVMEWICPAIRPSSARRQSSSYAGPGMRTASTA